MVGCLCDLLFVILLGFMEVWIRNLKFGKIESNRNLDIISTRRKEHLVEHAKFSQYKRELQILSEHLLVIKWYKNSTNAQLTQLRF